MFEVSGMFREPNRRGCARGHPVVRAVEWASVDFVENPETQRVMALPD